MVGIARQRERERVCDASGARVGVAGRRRLDARAIQWATTRRGHAYPLAGRLRTAGEREGIRSSVRYGKILEEMPTSSVRRAGRGVFHERALLPRGRYHQRAVVGALLAFGAVEILCAFMKNNYRFCSFNWPHTASYSFRLSEKTAREGATLE